MRKSKTGRKNPGATKRLNELWAEDYEGMCKRMSDGWTDEKKAERSALMKEKFANDPDFNPNWRAAAHHKTASHRQAMRDAKLGTKFSESHKASMKAAHSLRHKVTHSVQAEHKCTYRQAQHILRDDKEAYYAKYA